MIFLLLSIISSTLIGLIFSYYERFRIDTFQAVVANYFTCVLTAWASTGEFPLSASVLETDWLPYALGLSVFFISGFTLVGITYRYFGITITTIAVRMSMILTLIFAFIWYDENITVLKILGILMAIAAIWLTNIPHAGSLSVQKQLKRIYWSLPLIAFLIQALIEIVLQYVELNVLGQSGDPIFVATLFAGAGIIGLTIMLLGYATGKIQPAWRHLWAGIILGIPNYFSIYFLLRAIGAGWEGSVIFPINNVAIIGLSALLGYLLLKEKLSRLNMVGVAMAMIAIVLIALGA